MEVIQGGKVDERIGRKPVTLERSLQILRTLGLPDETISYLTGLGRRTNRLPHEVVANVTTSAVALQQREHR